MAEEPDEVRDSTDRVAGGLLRDLMRLTRLDMAGLGRAAGVPQALLGAYVSGDRQPTLGELIRIVEAAGLELRLLLDTRDRHDNLLPLRVSPEEMEALAREERQRVARLKQDATVERLTAEVLGDLLPEDDQGR